MPQNAGISEKLLENKIIKITWKFYVLFLARTVTIVAETDEKV